MIFIQNHQTLQPHLPRSLRRRAQRILQSLRLEHADVSTVLCDDAAIQDLNAQWRHIDATTDVLSFPQIEKPSILALTRSKTPVLLGDIVISVTTCLRQAHEYHHSCLDEATRLWLHGLLHLCGFDHERPRDAKRMLTKEEKVLALFSRRSILPLTHAQAPTLDPRSSL